MTWSGILGKTAVGLGAVAVPVVFAVAGAGPAAADPGVCVAAPWGYASACVDGPGWVDWNPGVNWGRPDRSRMHGAPGTRPVTGRVVPTAFPVPNVT